MNILFWIVIRRGNAAPFRLNTNTHSSAFNGSIPWLTEPEKPPGGMRRLLISAHRELLCVQLLLDIQRMPPAGEPEPAGRLLANRRLGISPVVKATRRSEAWLYRTEPAIKAERVDGVPPLDRHDQSSEHPESCAAKELALAASLSLYEHCNNVTSCSATMFH